MGSNRAETGDLTWNPAIAEMIKSLHRWKPRNLSLFGKTTAINSLELFKLWYLGTVQIMPQDKVNKAAKETTNFLLKERNERSKRIYISARNKANKKRGLHVQDVNLKMKSLRLQWFMKIMLLEEKRKGPTPLC